MRALRASALHKVSIAAFAAHAGLIAFSTAAMLTILNGPPGAWATSEPSATVMRVAWKFSGPTYVTFGALAALAHAAWAFGIRPAMLLFVTAVGLALGTELLGTSTGFPFGGYAYTSLLGYRVLGLVPFPIPLSWFYMLYAALAICARVLPARAAGRSRWLWAAAAATILTAWDVAMDPAMVRTSHWVWHEPGVFYGMPLTNWIGWFGSGLVIARVMLVVAPPQRVAERNAREWLPLALYAANGVMPIAICLRDGLWWAAVLGAGAMAIPLALGLRAGVATREARQALAVT